MSYHTLSHSSFFLKDITEDKGNVFQCRSKNSDKQQCLKTVKVQDERINKTFEYPQDVATNKDSTSFCRSTSKSFRA